MVNEETIDFKIIDNDCIVELDEDSLVERLKIEKRDLSIYEVYVQNPINNGTIPL
ncbi:MAG: hypothetical protein JJE03_00400 [Peptostreptococcaceae bacterium]|nr:hypothetical protein [Peptostreptococcaceae bacterium]